MLGADRDFSDVHRKLRMPEGMDADAAALQSMNTPISLAVLALGLCYASAQVGEIKDPSHSGDNGNAML